MPIYEYRCEQGHLTEVRQSFTDAPLEVCGVCGAAVQKVLHSPAIHYKGSGFYSTDYGRGGKKNRAGEKGEGSGDSPKSSGDSSGESSKSSSSSDSSSGETSKSSSSGDSSSSSSSSGSSSSD